MNPKLREGILVLAPQKRVASGHHFRAGELPWTKPDDVIAHGTAGAAAPDHFREKVNDQVNVNVEPSNPSWWRLSLAVTPILLLATATGETIAEPRAKPSFSVNAEGACVTCGSKTLTLRREFGQLRLVLDSAVQCHAEVMQDFGQGPIGSVFFLEKGLLTQGTEATFTAKPRMKRAARKPLGEFSFRMELLDDGWVRLTSVTKMKPEHAVKDQFFFMNLPDFMPLTGTVRLAGRTVVLGDKTYLSISEEDFGGARISLYPDDPASCLEVLLDEGSTAAVNKRRLGIRPRAGRLSFRINLQGETGSQRSDQFYSGVDFWDLDRLRLPDYRASRNLLRNPSFEVGTRYYNYPIWGSLPW